MLPNHCRYGLKRLFMLLLKLSICRFLSCHQINLLRPQIEMCCVSQVEVFLTWCDMLMSGDAVKQPKTSICTYTYDGKIARMSLEYTKANIQSYDKYSVDKAASWLSPARLGSVFLVLLATCSTLFPSVMPYLFFNTLRSTPTHSSACQYIIPLFHFSTIFLDKSSILLFFFGGFWPSVSIIDQIRPRLFFSSPSSQVWCCFAFSLSTLSYS